MNKRKVSFNQNKAHYYLVSGLLNPAPFLKGGKIAADYPTLSFLKGIRDFSAI